MPAIRFFIDFSALYHAKISLLSAVALGLAKDAIIDPQNSIKMQRFCQHLFFAPKEGVFVEFFSRLPASLRHDPRFSFHFFFEGSSRDRCVCCMYMPPACLPACLFHLCSLRVFFGFSILLPHTYIHTRDIHFFCLYAPPASPAKSGARVRSGQTARDKAIFDLAAQSKDYSSVSPRVVRTLL
jgi:hypothetical protein